MTSARPLTQLVRPGMRIAVADGVGAPRSVSGELTDAARAAGDVRLLLGWLPTPDPALDLTAFTDVRAFMGGWGLRAAIESGCARSLPVRLGALPALLRGPLRPDLLVASLVARGDGLGFGSEVAWMRAVVDAGVPVAAVVSDALPAADAGPALPSALVTVIDESSTAPIGVTTATPDDSYRAIGERVAALIPAGARLQVGPGPLGSAVLQALSVPVHIDSGMLIDGVATLDARGLLLGTPIATYLSGTESLYGWAAGRPVLHPVEVTHDLGRASAPGLFCVNTALEVDLAGNVNVEGTRRSLLGGIGGHADYAVAASRSIGGLSVIGLPVLHDGSPTLVRALSQPVTTPGHDVDVVVTERGCADLRGRDRAERRALLEALWGGLLREEGTA